MNQSLENLRTEIRQLDFDSLQAIQEEIDLRQTFLDRQNVKNLLIGTKVKFKTNKGNTLTGSITKVGRKNVHVKAPSLIGFGVATYSVPASAITKI